MNVSDGSNNVRSSMFDRLKPKMGEGGGVRVRLPIDEHIQVRSMFKNDVRVGLMFNNMMFDPSLPCMY